MTAVVIVGAVLTIVVVRWAWGWIDAICYEASASWRRRAENRRARIAREIGDYYCFRTVPPSLLKRVRRVVTRRR